MFKRMLTNRARATPHKPWPDFVSTFGFALSKSQGQPATTTTKKGRAKRSRNKSGTNLLWLLIPFFVGLVFLLTGCDYDTGGAATPKPPPTLEKVTPVKTEFGPAGFLVEGVSNLLNSFANFLGNIGVGVLKWFIYTTDSLNLTRSGAYRLCQIDKANFNPATPIDPLASCSIAVYDEIKYLPAALLGVVLVYFLVKYTFQGLFGSRLSLTDFVSNIFLVVLLSFNLDFIITLVIDVSSKIFLLMLTLGGSEGAGTGNEDLGTIAQNLDKLITLFNIASIHKQDLGIALVLVIICIPAVLALMVMGIFFFTRVIFFLLYFLLGVPAVTARLTDETDFFFTGWYTGLLKLAASSLPLAIVLRLGLEVAKVLELTPDIDPIQYIIMMLVITLIFGAGGFYAFIILRSEVRRGVATVNRLGGVVATKISGANPNGNWGNRGLSGSRNSLPAPAQSSASPLPAPTASSVAGSIPGASSRGGGSGDKISSSSPLPAGRVASSSGAVAGAGAGRGSNLALTPQLLTNAISTGLNQAFTSQFARNDRVAGAVLNQLTSIRVALDEMKVSLQLVSNRTQSATGSSNWGYGSGYGYGSGRSGYGYNNSYGMGNGYEVEAEIGEYREVREASAGQLTAPVRGYLASGGSSGGGYPGRSGGCRFKPRRRYPRFQQPSRPRYSTSVLTTTTTTDWEGVSASTSDFPPLSLPAPASPEARLKVRKRRYSSRNRWRSQISSDANMFSTTPGASANQQQLHLGGQATSSSLENSSEGGIGVISSQPYDPQTQHSGSDAGSGRTNRARFSSLSPETKRLGRRNLARPFNPGTGGPAGITGARNSPTRLGGVGTESPAVRFAGNSQPPSWEASVQMLVNPNTGLPYTGQQSRTRLKPIRSVSASGSGSNVPPA